MLILTLFLRRVMAQSEAEMNKEDEMGIELMLHKKAYCVLYLNMCL
jgi:hypothetical protein